MSAKLCCVAQACCLSTWVAQVGGSGASHKKACLTLKALLRVSLYYCCLVSLPQPGSFLLLPSNTYLILSLPCSRLSSQHLYSKAARQWSLSSCLTRMSSSFSQKPWHLLTFLSPNVQPQAEVLPCTSQMCSLPFHTAPATPTHPSGAAGSTQPSANLPQRSVADRLLGNRFFRSSLSKTETGQIKQTGKWEFIIIFFFCNIFNFHNKNRRGVISKKVSLEGSREQFSILYQIS